MRFQLPKSDVLNFAMVRQYGHKELQERLAVYADSIVETHPERAEMISVSLMQQQRCTKEDTSALERRFQGILSVFSRPMTKFGGDFHLGLLTSITTDQAYYLLQSSPPSDYNMRGEAAFTKDFLSEPLLSKIIVEKNTHIGISHVLSRMRIEGVNSGGGLARFRLELWNPNTVAQNLESWAKYANHEHLYSLDIALAGGLSDNYGPTRLHYPRLISIPKVKHLVVHSDGSISRDARRTVPWDRFSQAENIVWDGVHIKRDGKLCDLSGL